MCGITGIINSQGNINLPAYILEMTDALRHRGPDGEGFVCFERGGIKAWSYGGEDTPKSVYDSDYLYTPRRPFSRQEQSDFVLALGHRRLSIIDLSAAAHQPMCTPNRRYWIVYNGEIYNYLELKEELVKEGYSFRSRGDTEVLLNSYAHWGVDALRRLIGMFAFAIYDREEKSLFLARDFFGIKPLYYTVWPAGFAFASEIKALLRLPHINRKVNPQRVYEYLRFALVDHGEQTLYKDIVQLPAAHYLYLSLEHPGSFQPVRYWDIDLREKADISLAEASVRARDIFLKNVALHLRSDVPIGTALSGGIDSSSIVMSMRKVQASSLDLSTFSFIAEDPSVNEERWVDLIGKAAGAAVHKVKISPDELLADLDHLIYCQDEPFGSTTIYAQYRVMRLAKENGIKVMLDGQGADEMLGGYRLYFAARLASLCRQLQWLKAFRFFLALRQYADCKLKTILMEAGSYFLPDPLRNYGLKLVGMDLIPPWLKETWFRDHQVQIAPSEKSRKGEILRGELYRSLKKDMLLALLRYEDRNSMAFSIESRVPFLTPELTSFIASLPEEYLIDLNGTSKLVFRHAMRGIVPKEILQRKDKIGFATPEQLWLQHLRPSMESILGSEAARRVVFFDSDSFQRRWREALEGRKPFDQIIWRCINLILWAEQRHISF